MPFINQGRPTRNAGLQKKDRQVTTLRGLYDSNSTSSEFLRAVMDYALETTPSRINCRNYDFDGFPDRMSFMSQRTARAIEGVFDSLVRERYGYLTRLDEKHDKDDAWRSDRLALQVLHHLFRMSGRNWFWKPVFMNSDPGYCDFRPQTVDEMCADLEEWYRASADRIDYDPDKLKADLDFVRAHLR